MARLSQVFTGKDRVFFDLFEEAAANVVRGADLLDQMLAHYPDRADLARDIVICEQEGDRITHDVHPAAELDVRHADRPRGHPECHQRSTTSSTSSRRSPTTSGSTRSRRRWSSPSGWPTCCCRPTRQIAEAMPRLRAFERHLALHGRDQPPGERRRPDQPRRDRVAVRERHRPDGRHPLEGHLRAPRGGDRRLRARRQHARGHRHQEPGRGAPTSSWSSSSPPRSCSTSPTASTTPPTRSRPRSRPARCRRASAVAAGRRPELRRRVHLAEGRRDGRPGHRRARRRDHAPSSSPA